MAQFVGSCVLLLAALICIQAAPHESPKETSHAHESESVEIETKESKESSEGTEEESEYHDADATDPGNHSVEKKEVPREDLLRPMRLTETYGIPDASQNPDMKPLIDILAMEGTPVRFG